MTVLIQLHILSILCVRQRRAFESASPTSSSAAAESRMSSTTAPPVPPVLPPTAVERGGGLPARQTPIALCGWRLSSTNSLVMWAKACSTIPLHSLIPLVEHAPAVVLPAHKRPATRGCGHMGVQAACKVGGMQSVQMQGLVRMRGAL